jgi:DsbC/DsbD-like thiol-disulfide interchange protein
MKSFAHRSTGMIAHHGTDRCDGRLRRSAAVGVLSLVAISCAAGAALMGAAWAGDDASPWNGDARSAVRLIAGSAAGSGGAPVRAGIEMRLKAGWHTYWRYPGDAGVPPRIDFAGSQNLQSVTVLWPAPQRIVEEGLTAIGYTSDVILPLAVVAQSPGKPVMLRLKLDYAVCEKLCVPAEGQAELTLASKDSAGKDALANAALTAAVARVPKQVALGAAAPLAIRAVKQERDAKRVIVDVAAPAGVPLALFAEGPTAEWALPVPMAIDGAPPGQQRFAFELDGAPPGAKYEGAAITLTAVAGAQAIEVVTRLD